MTANLRAAPTVNPWAESNAAAVFAAGWRWCATGRQWYLVTEVPDGDLACKCGMKAPPP